MSLSEILKQLPETDREIQAKEPPPQNPEEQKRRRRDQYPESWGNASKFTGPDPDLARKLANEVFSGGSKSVRELISHLDGHQDYKPEYLLRCLGVFGNEKERTLLVKTMASHMFTLKSPRARSVVIRELQWSGSGDAVKTLGTFLTSDLFCDEAAAALTAIGNNAATSEFRKAFPKSTGKCRITIAQNLGVLGDTKSVELLRSALQDTDPDLRSIAAWGLARIGDAQSADTLIKSADSARDYARTKATSSVLLLAETLAVQGKKTEAARIYNHLLNTRTDPKEKYVRDAAAKHLTVFML